MAAHSDVAPRQRRWGRPRVPVEEVTLAALAPLPAIAAVLHLGEDAPPGLSAVQNSDSLTEEALTEVLPHVPSARKRQIDLQLSFQAAISEGYFRIEHELARFPCIERLMEETMKKLGGNRTFNSNSLNVIVRRYCPGQGIGWHKDLDLFEEPVFGCVLRTEASAGLQFWNEGDNSLYTVPERAGVAFLLTGPARYTFEHGIDNIDGDRISVTWRWVRDSFIPQKFGGLGLSTGKGKGKGSKSAESKGVLKGLQSNLGPKEAPQVVTKSKAKGKGAPLQATQTFWAYGQGKGLKGKGNGSKSAEGTGGSNDFQVDLGVEEALHVPVLHFATSSQTPEAKPSDKKSGKSRGTRGGG